MLFVSEGEIVSRFPPYIFYSWKTSLGLFVVLCHDSYQLCDITEECVKTPHARMMKQQQQESANMSNYLWRMGRINMWTSVISTGGCSLA